MFFFRQIMSHGARSNRLGGLLENLSPRYFAICDHDTTRRRLREAEKLIDRHSVNLCRISRSLERMHIQTIIDDKLINLPTPTLVWPLGWNCRDRLNIHEAVRIIRKEKKKQISKRQRKPEGRVKYYCELFVFACTAAQADSNFLFSSDKRELFARSRFFDNV